MGNDRGPGEDEPTLTQASADRLTHALPTSAPRAGLAPGQRFGRYRIKRLLGRGGMGEVYEARHLESGRRLALKVLADAQPTPEALQRFLREGRLAASINDPHAVYIFGTEEIEGTWAIGMELVGAGTLKDRVKAKGPLAPREAVDAILQVILGLETAAAAGILHRDVKPSNCFVETDGTVKIGDFGLSLSTLGRERSHLTTSGAFLGTPAFAAPEQLRGEDLDVRSDIYSVGATLFYLLTGRAPFEDDNLMRLLTTIGERAPESPKAICPETPRGLADVVVSCLAKKPAQRPGDYAQLREALAPFSSAAKRGAWIGAYQCAALLDTALAFGMLAALGVGARGMGGPPRLNQALLLVPVVVALLLGIPLWFLRSSLGQWACGLQVSDLEGGAPDRRRTLLRLLIWVSGLAFGLVMDPYLTVVLFALSFKDSPPHGYRGLIERLSGTRVDPRPSAGRATLRNVEQPIAATSRSRAIGPYQLVGDAAESSFLLGYDAALRRQVWLRVATADTPPVTESRQEVKRATRLRWLDGARGTPAWDAYEAPSGAPLLHLKGPQPWSTVRRWLLDLAREIRAAAADATLPDSLSTDLVWVSGERARLLDFPPPGLSTREPGFVASDSKSIQRFLHFVAAFALSDTAREADAIPRIPIPLAARCLFAELRAGSFESLEMLERTLRVLAEGDLSFSPRQIVFSMVAATGITLAAFGPWAADLGLAVSLRRMANVIAPTLFLVVALLIVARARRRRLDAVSSDRDETTPMALGRWQWVTASGDRPRRWQVLARVALGALPLLLLSLASYSSFDRWLPELFTAVVALYAGGAVWRLVRPQRGPLEVLTGTWLVPAHDPFTATHDTPRPLLVTWQRLRQELRSPVLDGWTGETSADWRDLATLLKGGWVARGGRR